MWKRRGEKRKVLESGPEERGERGSETNEKGEEREEQSREKREELDGQRQYVVIGTLALLFV